MKKTAIIVYFLILAFSVYAAPVIKDEPQNTGNAVNETTSQVAEVASVYKGIVKLHVKLGDYVKKGQLLFEVNTDQLQALKKFDEANLGFMNTCVERAKKLFKLHSISKDDYQKCLRDYGVAQNQLKNTLAKIKFSKYYAPFDGTVTKIIRYDGSGLGDNDDEVEITQGKINVKTKNRVGLVCTRWPGVLELNVKLGEKVRKGQLLFKIQTDDIEAQKKMHVEELAYYKELYNRYVVLHKTSNVSLYDYYRSFIGYREAMKEVITDKLQITQSSGYAPFDGKITHIFRYSGSGNGSGKPVLNIMADE
jgi:multidrug efflux pump subunit AcrA (membrane-fusion protein)